LSDTEIVVQYQENGRPNRTLHFFNREWNLLDNGSTKYDPFFPEHRFPVDVGVVWAQDYRSSQAGGTFTSDFSRAKVVAFEKVTVPAGTFDAYRIERTIESRNADATADSHKRAIRAWYAPAAKRIVRSECTTVANGRERGKVVGELVEYFLRGESAKPGK